MSNKKAVNFKLGSFPNNSETFVISNIIYTMEKGLTVCIYTNKYLGISNSSQIDQFKKYQLEEKIYEPNYFNKYSSLFKKILRVTSLIIKPRILKYSILYLKLYKEFSLGTLLRMEQYNNYNNEAVTHVHFNYAIEPLIKLSEIGYINTQFIITFHGYDAFSESNKSFQKKYGKFYKNHVKAVTVNSKYLKNQIIKLGVSLEKIFIIPMGIDVSKFKGIAKKINKSQEIKIVSIGRLIQLKGHIYGINAFKQLIKQGYNCSYQIIGDGNEKDNLKKEVNTEYLQDKISFLGNIQQSQIVKILSESHIFLMPSTYDNESQRREAFGLTSIEAQAMGLPVIGFDSGGFKETIKKDITGYAVPDRDYKMMSEKMKDLINKPIQYEEMSKAAIDHAQSFDLKNTMGKFLKLYH